jgi:hypothetical protein
MDVATVRRRTHRANGFVDASGDAASPETGLEVRGQTPLSTDR